jgi:hypothetical protein
MIAATVLLFMVILLLLLLRLVVCPAGSGWHRYGPGTGVGPSNANQARYKPMAQQQPSAGGTSGGSPAITSSHFDSGVGLSVAALSAGIPSA